MEKLYALPNKNLLEVNQVMKNHIQVEEANLLPHGPPCFSKNQHERPSKWNHSPSRNESSMKNHARSTHNRLVYPNDHLFEVIRTIKANTLAPPPRHVTPKNLSCTYHSIHLRMYNPQYKCKFFLIKIIYLWHTFHIYISSMWAFRYFPRKGLT
jgi:hypothetical protein